MKDYGRLMSLTVLAALITAAQAMAQVSAINYYLSPLDYSYGVAAGPDGAIWYTGWGSSTGNAVARTSIIGETTTYPIFFVNSSPSSGLFVGPDGAMWFVDGGTNSIGRICVRISTTCQFVGDISEYPLPPLTTSPTSIVAGADGGMWFAAGSVIGRVSTVPESLGSMATYPVKSGNAAQEITAGPGGTLWFTEPYANAIGRVTTTVPVALKEFSIPYPSTFPWSITSGTDGALWFTGQSSQTLIRVTADLSWTAYTSPVPSPSEITEGPDGSVWFLGMMCPFECNYWLGRMTASGEGFSMNLIGAPSHITSGPDGAVWISSWGETDWIAQVIPTLRRNGVDISDSAGELSPGTVSNFAQAGIQYAVVKAPQDGGVASGQIEALLAGGINTAAYCFLHFQTNSPSGTEQATACLNTIEAEVLSISFMAIDVEETTGNLTSLGNRLTIINDALQTITEAGVRPVIYTMSSDWATLTGGSKAYSQYQLWNAASGSFEGYADPAGNLGCESGQTQQAINLSVTPVPRGGVGTPSLLQFAPFGGWAVEQGLQYDIAGGIPPKAACLFGTQVDFDVFSPSLFGQ